MNWKQFLTEKVLGECWHAFTFNDFGYKVCKCNGKPWIFGDSNERIDLHTNRTFDNRNDMMDLYEAIFKTRKDEWMQFVNYLMGNYGIVASPYIFCLSGEGYEQRCKMIAEFYGWREADHD